MDSDARPPETVGPYRLEQPLGAGGMGEVWSAWDQRLERRVALKQILPQRAGDPELRERFLREARAAARLSHPAIVQIYDLVAAEGGDWIVMEMVDGRSLEDLLAGGPISPTRAIGLGIEIAGGLAAAHAAGILHRDLKSQNILVTGDGRASAGRASAGRASAGRAKILDFGLAKRIELEESDPALTTDGLLLGTPRTMSPEQVEGGELDYRSDLFSFGVLLYEMVTGVSPFLGARTTATLHRILFHRQSPASERVPEVPRELSNLIDHLLEKDPLDRPQTAADVFLALKRLARSLNAEPAARGAESETETTSVPSTRRPGGQASERNGEAGPPRPPILYVDDDEDHLELFAVTFGRHYEVLTASSARQALEILRRREIRLILSDQRMPGMTGVQLFEAIQEEFPDPVRMIVTSYADIDAIIRAVNAGRVYRFISKPWDQRELKIILDRALESYDLKLRNRQLLSELEQRAAREREIRWTFQKYVPGTVVDELLDSGHQDLFLGELRIVAVLCFGIHDFGLFCSRLEPSQVVAFLNRYHHAMNRIVARHEGTVKDGRLAVFGAPLSSLDNAGNAVAAAREMLAAMPELNREEAVEALGEELRFGAGVSLGEVVAGNIGSAEKMEYTVIGEAVNVAARVHELTRSERAAVWVTGTVRDQTRGRVEVEAVEPARLRGRAGETRLYRVLA